MANEASVSRKWLLVDAKGKTLGRLASNIAAHLRGKHKPEYTPHVDTGDYIIVINAADIAVTGNKEQNKMYYRHTGYPGGIKDANLAKMRAEKPCDIITKAVKNMLPRGPLGRKMLKKLKVYAGSEHKHAAQQAEAVDL
jgi:large subunit ribosomal protein L13